MIKNTSEIRSKHLDDDQKTKLMSLSGVKQFPMRVKCATLSWHTFISAMEEKKEEIKETINKINKNLTLVEKIKKFQIINESFTIENGLLTPTMKVKRNKVILKYTNILENFYKK